MGYFEVIKRDGTTISLLSKEPFCVVKSATQETTLMGDDVVKMSVISTELLNFEKGDKIEVGGYAYTIRTAVSREMIAESHYLYEITFYGAMYDLMRVVYRDTDLQGRSSKNTFDLTYSAREFVNVLMNNLNRDFKGEWKFDLESCPETDTRTIQFAKQNCLQALQRICSEFSLEFCIYQKNGVKTLKVGYFGETINPLSGEKFFEWGRGLGLYSLKEDKVDENSQITRLWVEGGTNNIKTDYRDYAGRLQLPYPRRKNKMGHRLFNGSFVQPNSEYIGISNDSERFIEDHALRISGGSEEDVAIYDDIYPHRTGSVTGLVNNDINAFEDAMMDFDLTEKTGSGTKYLIDGVSAKITFISGKLSGRQFELAKKNGYNHSQRKFVLIPAEDGNGGFIPTPQNTSLRIAVGDKYKITDILLPQSYIDDAEEILWYKANKDFEERKQRRVQYQLTLDRLYLLEHSNNHEDVIFRVGDYIPVKDERFKVEGNIRVQKVVRNLLLEQDYTLTLSNSVSRGRSAQILSNLLQLNDNVKELPSKSWIYSSLASRVGIDELTKYATLDFMQLSLEKKAEKDELISMRDTFNEDIHTTVTSVFEDHKNELKGEKGEDGRSVSIADLGISWQDSQLVIGGVVSPNLKGDKGEDAVPIRANEYKAFGDIKLYPNDSFGCELIELGKGRIRLNITYKGTGQGGRTKASYYTHPTFANDERKTSICSFRVAKSSKPMTVGPWTSIEQNKREDGLFYYISRSGRRFCGFELMWNGQDAEIGDYAILEDFKIELIQDGEPLLPSTYVPHKDEMHGVQLSELVSNTDFMHEAAHKISEVGRFVSETALNSALADKVNTVELVNYATTEKLAQELSKKQPIGDYVVSSYFSSELSKKQPIGDYATNTAVGSVATRAIRPVEAVVIGSSTPNPFASILNDPNGEAQVVSLNIVEGTDLYLPPARLCAVGTKIFLRGSTMSCPVTPYHHSTSIRPIRIYSNERDVYSAGRYYTNNTLLETFTNAEWRVDLECIVAGCGLKGWLWTNSVESKNLLELSSSITTAIQSIAETRQDLSNLKNNVLKKGEGLQLGFFNLVNHNSGTYNVKATDYHIVARRTANGDTYPYIRVDNSLPVGHQFIVDIPFSECRVRFVIPSGASIWGNGGTEWTHGYRYHVTKSHTNEWGIIKTAYAQ